MTAKYLLYALIYTVIVAIIVFSVHNESYTITILQNDLSLPVAAWFALPLIVLALLSAAHMLFYSIKNFFDARAIRRDLEFHDSFAKEILLGLDSNKELKTDLFESSFACIKALDPWNKHDVKFKNEDLEEVYKIFLAIKDGQSMDIKRFKLPKNNALRIQNEINTAKSELKYALSLLSSKDESPAAVLGAARNTAVLEATYPQLEKLGLKYSFDEVKTLITRHADSNLELKGDELFRILNCAEFESGEYLQFAKILKKKISPDSLINIFKQLKNEHSASMEAYLYLLYDLQMIEDLRAALRENEGESFEKIEALLFLREHGKIAKADFIYNL